MDEEKVKEMLEQCSDEAALHLLSTDCATGLEGHLLARFERLKEAGKGGGEKGHVASPGVVLAASPSLMMPPSQAEATTSRSSPSSATSDVDRLLDSMSDKVRLEKLTPSSAHFCGHDQTSDCSEEEMSDSEVDKVIEWAKDAAVLDSQEEDEDEWAKDAAVLDSQEEDEDQPGQIDHKITPAPQELKNKTKASRWKFW
ncbi:hypothetical protein L7F22_061838 [Adiantum nelumboides]|nr:hypothetical protein [Adiantum nelumboides]